MKPLLIGFLALGSISAFSTPIDTLEKCAEGLLGAGTCAPLLEQKMNSNEATLPAVVQGLSKLKVRCYVMEQRRDYAGAPPYETEYSDVIEVSPQQMDVTNGYITTFNAYLSGKGFYGFSPCGYQGTIFRECNSSISSNPHNSSPMWVTSGDVDIGYGISSTQHKMKKTYIEVAAASVGPHVILRKRVQTRNQNFPFTWEEDYCVDER